MIDIILFIVNGLGWAIKPIIEKVSVDKVGYYNFTFLRYIISGLIGLPFLLHSLHKYGLPKAYKNNLTKFTKDSILYGTIVSMVAIAAIAANYYLLEKHNASYVTPIVEGLLLVFATIFSVMFLNEKLTTDMIFGISLIIVGVMLIHCNNANIYIFSTK